MGRRRIVKEAKNIGSPKAAVFCNGIDESFFKEKIRQICHNFYDDDSNAYVFPGLDYLCSKGLFFYLLHALLVNEKVLADERNVRPFMDMLKTILDSKMLVDRTGVSRLKADYGKFVFAVSTNTLNLDGFSVTERQRAEEILDYYPCLKRAWKASVAH